MTRKGALILSATASAFVLMLLGGLVARGSAEPPADWQAREAEYQKLLEEANRRLAEPPTTAADPPPPQPAFFEQGDDDEHHERRRHREHDEDDD